MTAHSLIDKLDRFKGKQIKDAIDEITSIADQYEFVVNVMDPLFNTASIDNEPNRLNVRTDKDSVITSFTIG